MEKLHSMKEKSNMKNQQKWWVDNPKVVLLFCLVCCVLYSFYYFNIIKFSDVAYLGGDTWEYQSIAVNYAKGHGFPIFGGMESFATYKMPIASPGESFDNNYSQFMKSKGNNDFYRTPGYPFFLGILYKIYGISPQKARVAQLFMLILIASFLPFIGYHYWSMLGFFGGLPAGILFMERYYGRANDLLTEPLIMFSLFLLVLAFIFHEKKANIISSLLSGIMLGLCLLVKGSVIFLPPLFLVYFIFRLINKKEKAVNVGIFMIAVIVTVLPWSLFATQKAGKPIILSTQGNAVMLDGNNEYSFKHGGWHPMAPDETGALYNQPEIRDLPLASKLFHFYSRYYDKVPVIVYNKLVWGFERLIFIKLAILLVILEALQLIIKYFMEKSDKRISPVWRWLAFGCAVLLGVAFFKIVILLGILFILLPILFILKRGYAISLPIPFFLLFLNFVILTIVVFGDPRFVSVIDSFFILASLRYVWSSAMTALGYSYVRNNRLSRF